MSRILIPGINPMWYTRLHDDGYPSHPNTNRSHAMNDATQSRQGKYRDSGRKEQEMQGSCPSCFCVEV